MLNFNLSSWTPPHTLLLVWDTWQKNCIRSLFIYFTGQLSWRIGKYLDGRSSAPLVKYCFYDGLSTCSTCTISLYPLFSLTFYSFLLGFLFLSCSIFTFFRSYKRIVERNNLLYLSVFLLSIFIVNDVLFTFSPLFLFPSFLLHWITSFGNSRFMYSRFFIH